MGIDLVWRFLGSSNKSMQRSTWKDSWEVCELYLPVVNFYFIFNVTLRTRLMFCWTGVPIRYIISLTTHCIERNFETNPSYFPKLLQALFLHDLTDFDYSSLPFHSKPHPPLLMARKCSRVLSPDRNRTWKIMSESSALPLFAVEWGSGLLHFSTGRWLYQKSSNNGESLKLFLLLQWKSLWWWWLSSQRKG